MTTCPNCGADVTAGTVFCPNCGTRVTPLADAASTDADATQPAPDVTASTTASAGSTDTTGTTETASTFGTTDTGSTAGTGDTASTYGSTTDTSSSYGAGYSAPTEPASTWPTTSTSGPGTATAASGKDPNTAFVIEIVAGLFGFLGVGHMYAGATSRGVALLVGWLVLLGVLWCFFVGLTLGLGACLVLPLHVAVPVGSAFWLKGEMQGRPIRF